MTAKLTVYVYTEELDALRNLYETALGVKADGQYGNWVPLELAGGTFALHAAAPGDDPLRPNVSFGVDDIETSLERFEKQGAKVLSGIADETFGRMATLQDPDGRVFELVQYG